MTEWYFAAPGSSERSGPFTGQAANDYARAHPHDLCWRAGLAGWQPVSAQSEFLGASRAPMPPPMPSGTRADDIDFQVIGNDMPFVEVELDPGESAVAEAGSLMYKDASIRMDTVFGDGSANDAGAGSKLMGAIFAGARRVVTGESLFTTVFTHQGQGKARVAFAAPYPGSVVPLKLSDHGGRIICQKDSFLAGARGVRLGIAFQKRILTGLFGGEGFIMQKLEGDGWVFIHCGGTLVERELKSGERLDVDTGCVAAYESHVQMDVQMVGGIKSMLFGGEGMFLATLTGPGKVWLQSLPFSRMAGRMLAAAPQGGGRQVGEGSILGTLGGLLDGDN